jgi:hypothetical protein
LRVADPSFGYARAVSTEPNEQSNHALEAARDQLQAARAELQSAEAALRAALAADEEAEGNE